MVPSANKDKIVLVTGINGYLAGNIGVELLRRGYTVRGTSRSAFAEENLRREAFKGYEEQYQHAVVPDITIPGAFDDVVKGVHAIIHTASPLDFTLKTVDDYFIPAVNGNISLLNSMQAAGPQLESFVFCSSVSAVVDKWKQPPDYTYSEDDWNTSGEAVARKEFTAPVAYGASKAVAERAMWDWQKQHQSRVSISAVNPGVITGPPVSWPSSPDKLNATLYPVWQTFSGEAKIVLPGIGSQSYIDVRDCARIHIWCMEHPQESSGQRYIATNGKGTTQAMADILRNAYPNRGIVIGNPGSNYLEDFSFPPGDISLPSTKIRNAMKVDHFIPYDTSILDTARAFEQRWPEHLQNTQH